MYNHPSQNQSVGLAAPSVSQASKKSRRGSRAQGQPVEAAVFEGLQQIHLHAAGIDIGAQQNYVCVPLASVQDGQSNVRCFGVFTQDHIAVAKWLKECQVTSVAMEATSVYWMSLCEELETQSIEVLLVDPHSVKHVPGRKSDVLDCQWLQQLHTYGLLRAAFRPDLAVRRLRVLCRHRADCVCDGSAHLQRAQKALVQMNVQLPLVVSDINGDTGLRIIEAILAGERDPRALVKLRDPRIKKSTVAEMEAALQGHYSPELLFVLGENLAAWKFYQGQIAACDQEIEPVLKTITAATKVVLPPPPKPVPVAADPLANGKKRPRATSGHNAPTVDFGEQIRRICGVDLTQVCGLNQLSVLMLLSEIGVDMSRWRNVKAFTSWLGLCPGTKISGGKKLSRHTRHVINRASVLLRLAALAAGRTNTWLGRFYVRKRAHLGAPKAITATARKLACVIYHMLKYQEDFLPVDITLYEIKAQEHRVRRLKKQAQEMGFELVQKQQVA